MDDLLWTKKITSCHFHWKGLQTNRLPRKVCTRKHSWSQSFLNQRHCLAQWTLASLARPHVDSCCSCCQEWHSPETHQFCSMAAKMCHSQNRNHVDLQSGSLNAETHFHVKSHLQVLTTKSAKRQTGCSLKPGVNWYTKPATCFDALWIL